MSLHSDIKIHYKKISLQISAKEQQEKAVTEKEENTARYEMQLTTLNENLSTLRLDSTSSMERLKELEKSNSEYLAQKLGK